VTSVTATPIKSTLIDITKCIGCRACQVACKQWNEQDGEETELLGELGFQNPATLSAKTLTLITFHELPDDLAPGGMHYLFTMRRCLHCLEPACASACPTTALQRQPCHVVVLDLCLNRQTGDQAVLQGVRAIRQLAAVGHRTLIYTADERPEPIARCVAAGAAGYVSKYLDTAQLARAIDEIGRQGRIVADELHHQYLLAFTATKLDHTLHQLDVTVRQPHTTVRARRTYLAE